jgi:CheY-like chemotaxis protein
MLSVIYENDQHSREILTTMLRKMGFARVHATQHLEESIYFLEKEEGAVDLIVSSYREGEGLDFPLSRVILKSPELDRCPLIVLTESWRHRSFSPFKTRLSRVDAVLPRPFGENALRKSVERAFEHRARFRSTLVYYGNETTASQLEEEILSDRDLQWKRLLFFQEPGPFLEYLGSTENRLGGMILESGPHISQFARELKKFKQSKAGASVPIAFHGQDPEYLTPVFSLIDVSFERTESWRRPLDIVSRRSVQSWTISEVLRSIRNAIKVDDFELAKKLLKEARKRDSERWELLELDGFVNKDVNLLYRALETQPYSPFAYLSLVALTDSSEKRAVLDRSVLYCPHHPELVALRK